MINRYLYPLELFTDPDGRVVAIFPDLDGAATDGADRAEALAEAADCLEEVIAGRMARREDIPPASAARGRPVVTPGAVISAKAALYTAIAVAGDIELGIGAHSGLRRRRSTPNARSAPRHQNQPPRKSSRVAG